MQAALVAEWGEEITSMMLLSCFKYIEATSNHLNYFKATKNHADMGDAYVMAYQKLILRLLTIKNIYISKNQQACNSTLPPAI